MSQHDMDVANGAGVVVRADINAALQALASLSSGASAPSPSFPCQLWADTGTSRLMRRNAANSAWVDEGPLDAVLRDASSQGEFAADTGTAGAYVCNFVPAITARSESTPLRFKAANANTGASTINDGVGTVALVGATHTALVGREIVANGIAWIQWNATVGAYVLLFCTGAAGPAVNQMQTAFTTAGTAPAFTLTPAPAIGGYAANQRYRVKFNAAAATSGTLNVSGLGAKNLKQYDSTGAKVTAVIASGQLADVEYDGTDMVVLDPLPATEGLIGIQGSVKNLAGSATGLSAATTYTMDEVIVESAANNYQVLRSVSITPSFANAGVNGLDVGAANSQTASTWYYVWAIWNGSTKSGLLSLSATAPTLPSGYTHAARISVVRTDSTANKYPLSFTQYGRRYQYKVAAGSNVATLPVMASGVQGSTSSPFYVAVAVGGFVPPTASRIVVVGVHTSQTASAYLIAPNNAYGGMSSTTNPAPMSTNAATNPSATIVGEFNLESTNIYYAGGASNNAVYCMGWEDNL